MECGAATRRRANRRCESTAARAAPQGLIVKKWLGACKFTQGCANASRAQMKRSMQMPKMKTKSGAKKRFRVRPGGTVKRGQAFKRHILTKKSTKNKRQLRGMVAVHDGDMGSIAKMMPMAGL
jgi:large subunit ribosomal protein L35